MSQGVYIHKKRQLPKEITDKYTIYYNKWSMPCVMLKCDSCGEERLVILQRGYLPNRICAYCSKRDKERIKKAKESLTGRIFSEIHKKRLKESWNGRDVPESLKKNWVVGRKISEEHRNKLIESHKGIIVPRESIDAMLEGSKRAWQDPIRKEKRLQKLIAAVKTPEARNRFSQSLTARWKSGRMARAFNKKPNMAEQELFEVINELCPNEYKFVGGGQVVINGKMPDFINVNGQKKIIEMYGDYWHRDDNPQDRIDIFAEYGYQTLIIWEREVRSGNMEELKGKIRNFNEKVNA
jgi:hypothetical protein